MLWFHYTSRRNGQNATLQKRDQERLSYANSYLPANSDTLFAAAPQRQANSLSYFLFATRLCPQILSLPFIRLASNLFVLHFQMGVRKTSGGESCLRCTPTVVNVFINVSKSFLLICVKCETKQGTLPGYQQ